MELNVTADEYDYFCFRIAFDRVNWEMMMAMREFSTQVIQRSPRKWIGFVKFVGVAGRPYSDRCYGISEQEVERKIDVLVNQGPMNRTDPRREIRE